MSYIGIRKISKESQKSGSTEISMTWMIYKCESLPSKILSRGLRLEHFAYNECVYVKANIGQHGWRCRRKSTKPKPPYYCDSSTLTQTFIFSFRKSSDKSILFHLPWKNTDRIQTRDFRPNRKVIRPHNLIKSRRSFLTLLGRRYSAPTSFTTLETNFNETEKVLQVL